jgi:import inner membrane translocase subunit TIM17
MSADFAVIFLLPKYARFFFFSPWRLIDDCGGAFSMGLIGGSLFNFVGGARHAPAGFSRRALGGMIRMKERAPVLGGQFAAWGLCFASFDCTFAHIRQKEDPWNTIMSGAAAGAVMASRSKWFSCFLYYCFSTTRN